MRLKLGLLSVLLLIFLFTLSNGLFNLTIFHNTDMNSHFEETFDYKTEKMIGGFSRLGQVLEKARSKKFQNVLYLNAGNTFSGTYLYHIYRWKIVSKMMNILKPDAVTLGSQEFIDGIKGLEPFLENINFPVISSNIIPKENSIFFKFVKPSIILKIQNISIGIIGYTGKDTQKKYPVGDLKFTDELISVQRECKKLMEKNVKIIIALGNANFETDLNIAKEADCLDVLIGGDSTLFLWNNNPNKLLEDNPSSTYPIIIQNTKGKIVPILEGFSKAKYVGKIDLSFNKEGDLIYHKGNPILLDENQFTIKGRNIESILNNFTTIYHNNGSHQVVLAKVPVFLSADKCREEECNFGNMVADAMVHYKATKYKGKYWTDTPIAIINAGAIRNSINTTKNDYNLTQRDLAGAFPFRAPLITIVLEGKDLIHTLEVGARYNGETRRGEFLMVSGLKVIYDFRRPPFQRVLSVYCRCGSCKTPSYSPIGFNEHYRIVTTVFLANGGDGHTTIRQSSLSFVLDGITDLAATQHYLLSFGMVRPECEDRIINMRYLNASQNLNIFRKNYDWIVFLISVLNYLVFR